MYQPLWGRLRAGLLAALASFILATSVLPAFAETGSPRTDVAVTILSDSTSPDDPDDGEIQTLDIATYRLNLSQNGADSTSDVVATVSLVNALFSDADPIAPGINPPSVCN